MSSKLTAPDSSVLIAGFDPGHIFHDVAQASLSEVRDRGVLIAHTLAECLAVLSAGAYLAPADRVHEYLGLFLDRDPVGVKPDAYPSALLQLSAEGVAGGAIYDGLIALGARAAGVLLISFDRRAAGTYRRCGVDFTLLPAL